MSVLVSDVSLESAYREKIALQRLWKLELVSVLVGGQPQRYTPQAQFSQGLEGRLYVHVLALEPDWYVRSVLHVALVLGVPGIGKVYVLTVGRVSGKKEVSFYASHRVFTFLML